MNTCVPLVSIIVPVFNTGEILRQTINSLLGQTHSNLQIILVNDGSTDGSGLLCDQYADLDPRIEVLHKENGGICDARNAGLAIARGSYVTFCDHDDLFDPDLVKLTVDVAEREDVDLVKFSVRYVIENVNGEEIRDRIHKPKIYSSIEIAGSVLKLIEMDVFENIWDVLYRADWLKASGLQFDTRHRRGHEDIDFNNRSIPHIRRMAVISSILYTHYVRKSLSTSARFYDELIERFIAYPSEVLIQAQTVGRSISLDCVEYALFYQDKALIPLLAYMAKMGKDLQGFTTRCNELWAYDLHPRGSGPLGALFHRGAPAKRIGGFILLAVFRLRMWRTLHFLSGKMFRLR